LPRVTHYRARLGGWLGLVGLIAAAGYAQRFTGAKPPKHALFLWSTFANELITFAFIAFLVWLVTLGLDHREAFALRRPASWRGAFGAMGVAVIVVAVVNGIVTPFLNPGREQGITSGWEHHHTAAFVGNFLVFTFVGPVVEELTFRGIGFRLLARFGRIVAVVLVGLLFGVWHGLVEALPVLVTFGWLLAWIRERTHSVYPCCALHAFFNGIQIIISVSV
jgi:uncharacterized protein